jgi:hypothetical protein
MSAVRIGAVFTNLSAEVAPFREEVTLLAI